MPLMEVQDISTHLYTFFIDSSSTPIDPTEEMPLLKKTEMTNKVSLSEPSVEHAGPSALGKSEKDMSSE